MGDGNEHISCSLLQISQSDLVIMAISPPPAVSRHLACRLPALLSQTKNIIIPKTVTLNWSFMCGRPYGKFDVIFLSADKWWSGPPV